MNNVLKIAARNVAANKKRTLITVLTIIVGVGAINLGKGIMSGIQTESILSLTEGRTGELQIHRDGYFDANEMTVLNYSIDNFNHLREELLAMPEIEAVAGRIQFGGIVAKEDEESVVVFCRAADTVDELKVCPRLEQNISAGRFLGPDTPAGAVIAGGLHKGIGAKLGDLVIIVANTKDRFQNAVELEIVGIIEETAAQANARLVYLPIAVAQELLYMEDEATEIVLKTRDGSDLEAVSSKINESFAGSDLESNTWMQVSKFFVDIIDKQNAVVFVICFIFYIIVIGSITNTMILTVFERKKEIGTMMAIGIKARKVIQMIILESAIIGFIGSLAGVIIGAACIAFLNVKGLTFSPGASDDYVTIRPLINPAFMIASFALGVISAVLASFYPSRKVLNMNPIDALRGN